ncbi:MAG: hypothetical protein WBW85_04560 [Terriglobales bacterium]
MPSTRMDFMLTFDQIRRELKAILDFDRLFLTTRAHYPEEQIGFELRELRKKELLGLAKLLASKN